MTLTRKEAVATGVAGLVLAAFLAMHEGWDVPLIGDSHRWATAVVMALGIGACALGARRVNSTLFGVLGGVALVFGGTGLIAGYLFARHDLDLSVADSRTVALTTLIASGLYLVMALEAGGSRRRSTLVAGMCAVMAALYIAALLIPATRGASSPSPCPGPR